MPRPHVRMGQECWNPKAERGSGMGTLEVRASRRWTIRRFPDGEKQALLPRRHVTLMPGPLTAQGPGYPRRSPTVTVSFPVPKLAARRRGVSEWHWTLLRSPVRTHPPQTKKGGDPWRETKQVYWGPGKAAQWSLRSPGVGQSSGKGDSARSAWGLWTWASIAFTSVTTI